MVEIPTCFALQLTEKLQKFNEMSQLAVIVNAGSMFGKV